jgi:hypothetical protein
MSCELCQGKSNDLDLYSVYIARVRRHVCITCRQWMIALGGLNSYSWRCLQLEWEKRGP